MFKITNHFLELQYKIFYIIISWIILIFCNYFYNYEIIELLSKPLKYIQNENINLYYSEFLEIFQIKLYIYIILSLNILLPFILWNFWLFLIPGISKKKKFFIFFFLFFFFLYLLLINNYVFLKLFPIIIEFSNQNNDFNENDDIHLIMQIEITKYFILLIKIFYIFNFILIWPFIHLKFIKTFKWILYKKYYYIFIFILLSIFISYEFYYIFLFWIFLIIFIEILHFIQHLKNVYIMLN